MHDENSVLQSFSFDVGAVRDAVHVRPVGALDLATVPELAAELRALRDDGWERLVLDLRGVLFADSTALRLMLEWSDVAREEGFAFEIVRGPPAVQKRFDPTGASADLSFIEL